TNNFVGDLGTASDVLDTAGRNAPLMVRVDINWKDIQPSNSSSFDFSMVKKVFTQVLRPGDVAYVILGTHSLPIWLGALFPDEFHHPDNASAFVAAVVKCITGQSNDFVDSTGRKNCDNWADKVAAWQVDREPFAQGAGLVDAASLDALSSWLESVKSMSNKPTVINFYVGPAFFCHAGRWFLIVAVEDGPPEFLAAQRLFRSLDVMGVDIYPDQLSLCITGTSLDKPCRLDFFNS